MRKTESAKGLTVQAVAGTHAVLLGFDLAGIDTAPPPSDLLGFAIRRTDHTEDERAWLRGLKVFASVVPAPGGAGGGPDGGIWKTTNGGKTFVKLTAGLPPAEVGRIALAAGAPVPAAAATPEELQARVATLRFAV
mgnify:CR=1 FL=1